MSSANDPASATVTVHVPNPNAPWPTIWEFALTYNAYTRHGGFDPTGQLANAAEERWSATGELPAELNQARAALFFEQRRFRHFGEIPTGSDERYIRALVERISELSGGPLSGRADPLP